MTDKDETDKDGDYKREDSDDESRAENDPRNIGDQDEEHSAAARGAEVELSPEEREEKITSAAPDGGEIQDTPQWPAEESERDEAKGEGEGEKTKAEGESDEDGKGSSRVSVVDESPPRPEPPEGESDDEYKWHTYKVYPSGRPDAVEFIDTYKAFGRTNILRGLNMGLPEGMVSMILGPSGTGKSVCIKHMVGLLYPDKGDILVHGESVPNMADDDLFDMRKKFGLLFQDGALFGSMNLYDNVAFPLRQHTEKGEDEIEDIVMRRLNEVGLGSARLKAPNELSGGMKKRAGFARALVLEPDIVLFDEPDSGLDPVRTALLGELILEIHRDMMDEAKEAKKEHLPTFCVITHDIMSARRVADYINVLWKGRIVEAGPAEDMLNSENPFIRQFLSGESQGPLTMD
jgi:phospholipid/cholesterol/gamma-HCH transport system ATP-binding protein